MRKQGVAPGALGAIFALALLAAEARASDEVDLSADRILEFEIEDLLDIRVTSIVKAKRKLSEISAAISVITGEDMRRAGHTSIAEALRMVPGFHVAHIDANKWSVSSRGFAGRFTDKLLVLVDGRSVYTPLFAGVFWDVQDTFLPDLDRIEVIRGPGATLWGANAVNGVVNVLTKSARDTQGLLVYGAGGLQEAGLGGFRYGGRLRDDAGFFRVFVKAVARDDFADAAGTDTADEWHQVRGGFRVDAEPGEDDSLTVSGEIYAGQSGEQQRIPTFSDPFLAVVNGEEEVAGGHLLARWKRRLAEDADFELLAWFDRTERSTPIVGEERSTFEVDFQHRFSPRAGHRLLWGVAYRVTTDRIRSTQAVAFDPTGRTDQLVSGFVQDEITLLDERLVVTLGTKLEHNDYSGFEIQPGARALYRVHERHSMWAAITRAVRTPSRADHDVTITAAVFDPGSGPTAAKFVGSRGMDSEEMLALEFGYRVQPTPDLMVEFAGFLNLYEGLRTAEPGAPFGDGPPPHTTLPSVFTNGMDGDVYGVEVSASWEATEYLRLVASYSFLRLALDADATSTDPNAEAGEGESPRNQAQLRAILDLSERWEADVAVYYVDSLPALRVGSYVRLDARVGWRPNEKTLVELVLRNALDDQHPEFSSELPFTQPTEVETALFVRFTRRW